MKISEIMSWGKASGITNRNVQILTEVFLKVNFGVDSITLRSGSKFAAAEIEVQGGKVVSVRFKLGDKKWTSFQLIHKGIISAKEPQEEIVNEDTEVEEIATAPVPAVEVTDSAEEQDDDNTASDAVPATE